MDEGKKETSSKKRIYKLIFIVVISIVILGLLCMLLIYILLNDNNKNKHVDNGNENSEIIKKEFVNGFKSTSTTGQFSFSLTNDDINQMLMNATKAIGDSNIQSIYYEEKDNKEYFYIDLPTKFVPTRVIVETYISNVDNYVFELKINKVSKGKLNIFDKAVSKGYLTKSFVETVASCSSIPISYDEKNTAFYVDILSIINKFPSGEIKDSLFLVANSDKSKYISYGSSLFSFNIDFSKMRSNGYKKSKEIGSVIDFRKGLEESARLFDISTVTVGNEAEIYSFSEDSFSSLLSSELNTLIKETYDSSLISNEAIFEIKYIHALFDINKINYSINVSINGYEIDVSLCSNVLQTYPLYRTYLNMTGVVNISEVEYDSSSDIANQYTSYLYKVFKKTSLKYNYFSYSDESKVYGFDFSSIETVVIRPELIYQNLNISGGKASFSIKRVF